MRRTLTILGSLAAAGALTFVLTTKAGATEPGDIGASGTYCRITEINGETIYYELVATNPTEEWLYGTIPGPCPVPEGEDPTVTNGSGGEVVHDPEPLTSGDPALTIGEGPDQTATIGGWIGGRPFYFTCPQDECPKFVGRPWSRTQGFVWQRAEIERF